MHFPGRLVLFYVIGLVFVAQSNPSSVTKTHRNCHAFVLGKTLYIDGGEASYSTNGAIVYNIHMSFPFSPSEIWSPLRVGTNRRGPIVNSTLAIDLSLSFSTSLKNNGVQIQNVNKALCPNFNYIRFWVDVGANTVYAYGGDFSNLNPGVGRTTIPLESFWSFAPNSDGGTWQSLDQSSTVFNSIIRPTERSVAFGDIGGFNLGGYAGPWSSQKIEGNGYIPVPGLQFYNFTSQEWFNNSATAYTPDGTAIWSGTVYVPTWGSSGLLVAFGGQKSFNTSAFVDGDAYLSMSNISLFDPSTQSWYHQQATGVAPTQRDRFCVVGMNDGDNSTYEIFLYGGQVGNGALYNNAALDEVYVLSLPSFVWFKANYTSSDPRVDHTCNVAGNRQMPSIGGLNPTAASLDAAQNDTDRFWEGIKVFDLAELQWSTYFNASAAPYTAPIAVAAHLAAGSKYPSMWSSDDLESLFVKPSSSSSTPTEPSSKSSTPTKPSASASPPPGASSKANHQAAVIGGAIGGVVAVALLGFALYLLARMQANKTRRKMKESKPPPMYTEGRPNPLQSVSEAVQALAYEADSPQALPHDLNLGKTLPHEADSRQAMPQEVSSGQYLPHKAASGQYVPHEADSGLLYELPSRRRECMP